MLVKLTLVALSLLGELGQVNGVLVTHLVLVVEIEVLMMQHLVSVVD